MSDVKDLRQEEWRKYIIQQISDEDCDLDIKYLSILLEFIKSSRDKQKVKELNDGRQS